MSRAPGALLSAALVGALASLGQVAQAEEESFWAGMLEEKESAYERHLSDGDAAAAIAAQRHHRGAGAGLPKLIRRAVTSYEKAAKAAPSKAEPHYRAAEILYAHYIQQPNFPDKAIALRAIRHWNAFERLAPKDPRLQGVLFRRSITYTKLGGEENYRKAVEDYEHELRLLDEGSFSRDLPIVVSNAAELYMAIGELDEAITKYKRALRLRDEALYGYGLALALERDGQGVKAREVMFNYAYGDQMRALHRNEVFFIPEGDIHAYKALGYETLGDYDRAVQHYVLFLRAQPDGRHSDLARRRLEEVRKKAQEGGKTRTPRWEHDL